MNITLYWFAYPKQYKEFWSFCIYIAIMTCYDIYIALCDYESLFEFIESMTINTALCDYSDESNNSKIE